MWLVLDSRVNARVDTCPLWKTLEFEVYQDAMEIRNEWIALGQFANDPYSCFAWCQAWYQAAKEHGTGEALIVVGKSPNGEIDLVLPLFVEKKAGLRLVTRPARRVSGDFGGMFSPRLRKSVHQENAQAFWRRVAKVIRGDVLVINGISSDEIERHNPLGHLYLHQSRIDGFATTLEDNWEKQYESMFSAKIRRNDRRCIRRMAEEGKVDCDIAADPKVQAQQIEDLIEQKITQLEKAGQPHHYHDKTVRSFYAALPKLMQDSGGEEFLMLSLRFNGAVVATNFGVRKGKRHFGMMTSMDAAMRKYSPGRLVMLETAKTLTDRGCTYYDFGNGEYQYKQYWCTHKRTRHTALLALSWKGRLLVPLMKMLLVQKDAHEDRKAAKGAAAPKKEG